MIQLADRIRERGGEPREPLWYKHEYLRRLDLRIGDRTDGLRRRRRSGPTTCLVHGARPLLDTCAGAACRSTWPAAPTSRSSSARPSCSASPGTSARTSTAPRTTTRSSPRRWSSTGSSRENDDHRRAAPVVRRRLRRDREHQAGRRPGRRRRQRRGEQRLGPGRRRGSASGCSASAPTSSSPTSATPRPPLLRADPRDDDMNTKPLDLAGCKVFPLAERRSLTRADEILIDPDAPRRPARAAVAGRSTSAPADPARPATRGAGVMLIYGAHLLRNGAAAILERMMDGGWLTHLATNGAGTIHDWEYAWLGALDRERRDERRRPARSAPGTRPATNIHLALLAGAPRRASATAGRWAGSSPRTARRCPPPTSSTPPIAAEPAHPLDRRPGRPAAGDARRRAGPPGGSPSSIAGSTPRSSAQAFRHGVPMTVHPGIGYDIIANHPIFNGAAIGRAAERDFKLFGGSVETLDGGVVLSVGSAIMGPQVFEKSLSCVNNLRLQDGRADRPRPHDLRRRPPGRRRLGLDAGRAAEDEPGLLPALLQELLPDGRRDALPPVRQRGVPPPPLPPAGPRMTRRALPGHHRPLPAAAHRGRRRLLPRSLPARSTPPGRDLDRDRPAGPQRRRGPRPARRRRGRSSTTSSRSGSARSTPSASAATTARATSCDAGWRPCPACELEHFLTTPVAADVHLLQAAGHRARPATPSS